MDNKLTEKQLDEYVRALAGDAPAECSEWVQEARKLLGVLEKNNKPLPVEALLLVAIALYQETRDNNLTGLVQRLKQVCKWGEKKDPELTPMAVMENRLTEISRQVSMRLLNHEGFILLAFNNEANDPLYGISYVSSVAERTTTVKMLREFIDMLESHNN